MWPIFKILIEFVTIVIQYYDFVFWPRAMWDLSSPTRKRTPPPTLEGGVLAA